MQNHLEIGAPNSDPAPLLNALCWHHVSPCADLTVKHTSHKNPATRKELRARSTNSARVAPKQILNTKTPHLSLVGKRNEMLLTK
jgi:hypothetical protein